MRAPPSDVTRRSVNEDAGEANAASRSRPSEGEGQFRGRRLRQRGAHVPRDPWNAARARVRLESFSLLGSLSATRGLHTPNMQRGRHAPDASLGEGGDRYRQTTSPMMLGRYRKCGSAASCRFPTWAPRRLRRFGRCASGSRWFPAAGSEALRPGGARGALAQPDPVRWTSRSSHARRGIELPGRGGGCSCALTVRAQHGPVRTRP